MVLTALFPKAVHSSFEQKGDFLQFSKTSLQCKLFGVFKTCQGKKRKQCLFSLKCH